MAHGLEVRISCRVLIIWGLYRKSGKASMGHACTAGAAMTTRIRLYAYTQVRAGLWISWGIYRRREERAISEHRGLHSGSGQVGDQDTRLEATTL